MKKTTIRHIQYFFIISLFVCLITVSDIGCPILFFIHIPCPACGSTRALLSLIKFDFKGYLYYHALSLPLLVSVWLMVHIKLLKKQKVIGVFVFSVVILNFLYYLIRLYYGFIQG
ncbi:MAG: DUF2752 domain-containing protein [Clostridia bacterium]|nr:DUF2752 domain-containing protein [Clostridia bacterium]